MLGPYAPELPALIDLPVYQETYCDQRLTDHLCRYVWQNKPEFVRSLAEQEMLPFPDNRDAMLGRACERIEYYLKDEAKEGRAPELSMLGMIDLIYEIDRRVRKGLGLFNIPVVGTALAASPEGPFPELIKSDVLYSAKIPPKAKQNCIDEYIFDFYKKNTPLCYAYCEASRRLLRGGDVSQKLGSLTQKNVDEKKVNSSEVLLELRRRLHEMCNLPNYEQIKSIAPKGYEI